MTDMYKHDFTEVHSTGRYLCRWFYPDGRGGWEQAGLQVVEIPACTGTHEIQAPIGNAPLVTMTPIFGDPE